MLPGWLLVRIRKIVFGVMLIMSCWEVVWGNLMDCPDPSFSCPEVMCDKPYRSFYLRLQGINLGPYRQRTAGE